MRVTVAQLLLTCSLSYSVDTITIRGYNIGYVKGMAIHRNTDGWGDNWKLDKVTMVTGDLKIYNKAPMKGIESL